MTNFTTDLSTLRRLSPFWLYNFDYTLYLKNIHASFIFILCLFDLLSFLKNFRRFECIHLLSLFCGSSDRHCIVFTEHFDHLRLFYHQLFCRFHNRLWRSWKNNHILPFFTNTIIDKDLSVIMVIGGLWWWKFNFSTIFLFNFSIVFGNLLKRFPWSILWRSYYHWLPRLIIIIIFEISMLMVSVE